MVIDGVGTKKLYVDGLLVSSNVYSASVNYADQTIPWEPDWQIGASHWNDGSNAFDYINYYKGIVDDIGIWNRALTQQEITDLYNAQTGITIPSTTSCLNDTASVTITHPALNGLANAALRLNYNPDSLTYVGFTNLNPNFAGMTITGGNGTLLMDWNAQANQSIPAGNTVTLRFRVNGNSPLTWDTTFVPSEFSDINFNIIPQTFVNGSLTQNTQRLTWNRTICEGQSFSLGSQTFTTTGNYQGVLPRSSGQCDTLVNLSLHVVPRETTLAATICSNQPYSFNGQSLTSSGVYRDTLTNTLGCDSILVLNLTAHPAYNHPQTVRVCPGGTFNFGGNTLTTTGSYSHTYTTAEGCDSTVQLDFAVLDSIRIASSSGVNGFCPTFGVRLGLNAPIINAQYQWYRNGNLLSGEVSDTLMATQVGDYRLDVVISPTCTLSSNSLSVSELNCNRVRGDLRYDNNPQTPLAGVPVHLKTLLGYILMSDTTDSLGMYEMVGYPNGNYLLDAGVNYQWGGVNSTDALWVSRYFTSLLTLTPLRAHAGDVTGNGVTNSLDALNISRRGANLITTFAAGDFVNSRPSVVAGGNPVDMNLRALSTGDVNGSYGVVVSTPVLVLDTVYSTFPTGTATVRFTTSGSGIYERGVCWGTSPSPTIAQNKSIAGTGGFGFTHSFGGLTGGTLYYVRAYARNSLGTVYSNERNFTHDSWARCPGTPSLTDIDGNVYNTVQIGTQCWTQSNLTVSKYRNGNGIPNITNNTQWSQTNTGIRGWCSYNNDASNGTTFGKLYNWYAVNDSRGLCPTGWHVPTDSEWNVMVKYLDPNADTAALGWQNTNAGTALKSTTGWNNNGNGTNSSGFTGLPGGYRNDNGGFGNVGNFGYWWSSSDAGSGSAWYRTLNYGSANVFRSNPDQRYGFSVRCVRD
ncbi:MAG: FISUMP domain-containing protein [Bacteroidia bacterium]